MLLLQSVNPCLETCHCCRAEDFLTALPTGSVDMILTSPPYDNLRRYSGNWSFDFEYIARQSYRVLKPGGVMVWVVGDATIDGSETLTSMRQALYFVDVAGFRMHDTMIYKKVGVSFPENVRYYQQWEYMLVMSKGKPSTVNLQLQKNRWGGSTSWGDVIKRDTGSQLVWKGPKTVKEYGVMSNVWEFHAGAGFGQTDDVYDHPATFPEALAERHILTWSNPGDVVLDFFAGSGTTAKMARKHARRWLYCDISPQYAVLAEKRLSTPYTPDMFATQEAS